MSLRSPLRRAKGLGSAKTGTSTWVAERVTAIALIPLVVWFLVGLIVHAGADFNEARAWIASPVNAVLLVLLLGTMFHHAALGMQVIYEDYIHSEGLKMVSIYLTKFVAYLLAAASIFAVLKIAFGG